jgi:hypothetical protein
MFLICAISRRCFCSQLAQALLPTQPRRLHHICLKYCRSTSHFTRTALHTSSVIRQIFIRAKRVSSRSFYADIKHVSLHGVPSFVSPKGLEMIQTKVRRCIHFQTCRFQPPPPPTAQWPKLEAARHTFRMVLKWDIDREKPERKRRKIKTRDACADDGTLGQRDRKCENDRVRGKQWRDALSSVDIFTQV